jgi:hypothetical protein
MRSSSPSGPESAALWPTDRPSEGVYEGNSLICSQYSPGSRGSQSQANGAFAAIDNPAYPDVAVLAGAIPRYAGACPQPVGCEGATHFSRCRNPQLSPHM